MLLSSQQNFEDSAYFIRMIQPELFASEDSIQFPLAKDGTLQDKVIHIHFRCLFLVFYLLQLPS